jgi:cbb3-type cytochrome oxidase subunit 3
MEKNVLQAIEGVQTYPLISLVVFVIFFIGVILWVIKADKEHLKRMAAIPLGDGPEQAENDNFTN